MILKLLRRLLWKFQALLDFILIKTNQVPLPLIQGSFYWQISRVIEASISLGLFDILSETPISLDELASKLTLDRRGLKLLLDVLDILGYVRKTHLNNYITTKVSQKWLTNHNHSNFKILIVATQNLRKRWQTLEETIKTGIPSEDTYIYFAQHPDEAEAWYLALGVLAEQIGPMIARKVHFERPPKQLLDLGGSHGAYSVAFCRMYPEMKATIFDLPQGVDIGAKHIAELGFTKRIGFFTGNFWSDELGGPYDVILLFNIIHANSDESNISLLLKCHQALSVGGYIIILDQIISAFRSPLSELLASLVALNLLNEINGKVYDYSGIVNLLQNSKLKLVQHFQLLKAPGNEVFVAIKL